MLALRGDDARDRKLLGEVVKRVSKALRAQRDEGRVRSAVDRLGNLLWSRRAGAGDVVVSSIPGGASPRT